MLGEREEQSVWTSHCASECRIYDLCGGSLAAPCGCIHEGPRRYDCVNCPVYCLERKASPSIEGGIAEGLELERLGIFQVPTRFPAFIPLGTENIPKSDSEPGLDWVAIGAERLLQFPKGDVSRVPKHLVSGRALRKYLKASEASKVIAVLNSTDDVLERLWGIKRYGLFAKMFESGFAAITGPTFSVVHDYPASHNVVMMRRHNRVLQEASLSGLMAIPNIYWRNRADQKRWIDWMNQSPNINLLSRDFSRTRHRKSFEGEFAGLLEIVQQVERPLHVLLVGVADKNGRIAIRRIQEAGSTATVISASPVIKAVRGQVLKLGSDGEVYRIRDTDSSVRQMALNNIAVMERYFEALVKE